MKLGREHLPQINAALKSHPEFRDVTAGVGTADSGCFLVIGRVYSGDDVRILKALIDKTHPPLSVFYSVTVPTGGSETGFSSQGAAKEP